MPLNPRIASIAPTIATAAALYGGSANNTYATNIALGNAAAAAPFFETAARLGAVLHQLSDVAPSLEEAFMELTADDVTFHASTAGKGGTA